MSDKTTVKITLLSPSAQLPYQATAGSAGWDLYADLEGANRIILHPGEVRKISAGIAIALPPATFGAIYPRSGMAAKRRLILANSVAVIDADYRGPVIIALKNTSNELQIVKHGERIAQLVVQPFIPIQFEETNNLGTTARGNGGFGSTGGR